MAILRYLGRKYNLEGTTEVEKNRIAVLEQQVSDLNIAFFRTLFGPDFEKNKPEYLKALPDALKQLSTFLGSNQWVAGGKISYVDFWLYEYLIKIKVFAPQVFGKFPTLSAFVDRVEALPRVAEYIKASEPLVFSGPRYAWNPKY